MLRMTTNDRLVEKINLVQETISVFQMLTEITDIDNKIAKFATDFSRISEIKLIIDKRLLLHYKSSDAKESDTESVAKDKQDKFTSLLREQRADLETIIKRELHQDGALFTGRNVLGNILFHRVAIKGEGLHHQFIIEIINKDEVTIQEIVTCRSLVLFPLIACSLAELEKKDLENFRNSIKLKTKLTTEERSEMQQLVLPEEEPVLLTILYKLRFSTQTNTYALATPSKEDIALTVPTNLAKELICGGKWTFLDQVSDFVFRILQVLKKLVIPNTNEYLGIKQYNQDQVEPNMKPEFSFFPLKMRRH